MYLKYVLKKKKAIIFKFLAIQTKYILTKYQYKNISIEGIVMSGSGKARVRPASTKS